MSTAIAVNERRRNRLTLASRGTDPPRPASARPSRLAGHAADREQDVLPAFAPLLEELELAGWSSQWRMLSGHFHDWMLLDRGRVLVMVGQAAATDLADPMETALAAQAAAIAIRAHAQHTRRRRPVAVARGTNIMDQSGNVAQDVGRRRTGRRGGRICEPRHRGRLPGVARAGSQVRTSHLRPTGTRRRNQLQLRGPGLRPLAPRAVAPGRRSPQSSRAEIRGHDRRRLQASRCRDTSADDGRPRPSPRCGRTTITKSQQNPLASASMIAVRRR